MHDKTDGCQFGSFDKGSLCNSDHDDDLSAIITDGPYD